MPRTASTTRRLIVLGAGASYAVGLPDADRVLSHLTLFTNGPIFPIPNRTPIGLFDSVGSALITYAVQAGFRKGDRFPLDAVIEQFYAAAKRDPRAVQTLNMLWYAIREFLYSRSCDCADGYTSFADSLLPGDVILTFNWDICLEIALHRNKRVFTHRLAPHPPDGVWVLKPHGSIDFSVAQSGLLSDIGSRDAIAEDLQAPLLPIITPVGMLAPRLVRLRTYDLALSAEVEWSDDGISITIGREPPTRPPTDDSDVTPLHLERFLPDAGPFLLTPGSAQLLYDWSYEQTGRALSAVASDIRLIIVAGYSFPEYDTGVRAMLKAVMEDVGTAPVHIVNPNAQALPRRVLQDIFGEVTLHATGFLEYPWST